MQPLKAVLEVLCRHDVVVVLDGDLEEDLNLLQSGNRSYSIDGTYTKSLRRVGSARGCSEASDISHRGCSEASRRRSCLRKPGGSSRMALGRAGGHVQCRARGGGGIARARSRLASSGCQGKISNHLLYSKKLHVDLPGQGSRGKRHRGKAESPETQRTVGRAHCPCWGE